MRAVAAVLLIVTLTCGAGTAGADGLRLSWPLRPQPAVLRGFDAPRPNWQRGHRGVDLAGRVGQPVLAAAAGTVVFAGMLAGRPVVSVAHPGGLRTSYEPVRSVVRAGQRVSGGSVLGTLAGGHPGCGVCLHWGAMWGRSARADYVDPLGLLADATIRLKPASSATPR